MTHNRSFCPCTACKDLRTTCDGVLIVKRKFKDENYLKMRNAVEALNQKTIDWFQYFQIMQEIYAEETGHDSSGMNAGWDIEEGLLTVDVEWSRL